MCAFPVLMHLTLQTAIEFMHSAVAAQRFKVLGGQPESEFPRQISLKDFFKVGESVARHGHSQPLSIQFVFDRFDD